MVRTSPFLCGDSCIQLKSQANVDYENSAKLGRQTMMQVTLGQLYEGAACTCHITELRDLREKVACPVFAYIHMRHSKSTSVCYVSHSFLQ